MSTPKNTPTPTAETAPEALGALLRDVPLPVRPPVALRVADALGEVEAQIEQLHRWRPRGDGEQAHRARLLAAAHARCAGWWRVLARTAYHDPTVPRIYAYATTCAHACEQRSARFWRDSAPDWQARADRRPTSDAAGALSNWHELGITR